MASFARKIEATCQANYGHSGFRFIEHLVSQLADWPLRATRSMDNFKQAAQVPSSGYARRFAERFALAYAAGLEGRACGIRTVSQRRIRRALTRLRHASKPDPKRRAISLVIELRVSEGINGKMESYIEDLTNEFKNVWPIVCAAMYLLSETRRPTAQQAGTSMHNLIEVQPPTYRQLMRIIIDNPGHFFAACQYFLDQLLAESGLVQQHQPFMTSDDCYGWPDFKDLSDDFVPSEALRTLSSTRSIDRVTGSYTDYKRRGSNSSNTAKSTVHKQGPGRVWQQKVSR